MAEAMPSLPVDTPSDAAAHPATAAAPLASLGPLQQKPMPSFGVEQVATKAPSMWDEWVLQPRDDEGPVEITQGGESSSHQLRVS